MVMRDHKAPSTNCWPPRSNRVSETTEVFARDMFAKGMSKYVIEYMAYTYIYIYIYIHMHIYYIYIYTYMHIWYLYSDISEVYWEYNQNRMGCTHIYVGMNSDQNGHPPNCYLGVITLQERSIHPRCSSK